MMNDVLPPSAMPMDADISGEEFVRVFRELGPHLLNTLFCLLGNYADAQEASQDTFLKCWRARTSAGPVRDVRAWIFRIGINTARDTQRSAWRRRSRPLTAASWSRPAVTASPSKILEEKEDFELLQNAVMELHPDDREVFLLRQNDCLPYTDIARMRNSPSGTVKTQMHRAMAKLRLALCKGD
jgi:RNA polymerase sigma-70 factor (ECF subfamily)